MEEFGQNNGQLLVTTSGGKQIQSACLDSRFVQCMSSWGDVLQLDHSVVLKNTEFILFRLSRQCYKTGLPARLALPQSQNLGCHQPSERNIKPAAARLELSQDI